MSLSVTPVRSDESLPDRTSVVVIGGGIIGVSTALCLAERGIPVLLCEKGIIAGEQSSRNLGWCRKMSRDPRELPLIIESLRLWEGMAVRIQGNPGFVRSGAMYVCDTEEELAQHEAWLVHALPYQLDSRLITDGEIKRIAQGGTRHWTGALYTPSDGRAEPQLAVPAMAEAARRAGAKIVTSCAVRGIETQAGKAAAVVTERGRVACDAVVLAGGAWSSLFCSNLGIKLPQLKIRTSIGHIDRVDGGPECSIGGSGFCMRKCEDGGYDVMEWGGEIFDLVPDSIRYLHEFLPSALQNWKRLRFRVGRKWFEEAGYKRSWTLSEQTVFERTRVLDPAPHHTSIDIGQSNLAKAFPVFAKPSNRERWAGLIDVMPDAIPVMDAVASIPGFFIATGFSGHGFGIGPAAGLLMSQLVTGEKTIVDAHDFRLSRLAEGQLTPGRAL